MWLPASLLATLSVASGAAAQLTPSPTFTPPPAESGSSGTNGTNPNVQYSNLLGNALWFYDAQRTGKLPDDHRVPWRNDSVLSDGQDLGIDLTRGFFDAGDYSIDSFNLAGTFFEICWGATAYGAGYDAANQTPYLDSTLRWGLDWAMRAHPDPNSIVIQVGSTDDSNTYWGGDQNIPEPRPAYPINSTHPGTDLASAFASMFAMCSLLYEPGVSINTSSSIRPSSSIEDASFAEKLRGHAETSYNFAMNATKAVYPDSVPAAGKAYASNSYGDDLALAGIAMALLTNDSSYYADGYNAYVDYALSTQADVYNWDARSPAVFMTLVEASIARPQLAAGAGLDVNVTGWKNQMEKYLDSIVNNNGKRPYITEGGLLWYSGDSDAASLNPALNAATLLNRYAPLASGDKASRYQEFAKSQLDYALGKNPLNAVYVVGCHENSIKNPHSALASGGNDENLIDTQPEVEAYVLYGAVVGGPSSADEFWDLRGDYERTEIAIDYNAPMLTLVANQLVAGDNTDPYYTSLEPGSYHPTPGTPCNDDYPCGGGGGLSTGAKAAIGVVVPVVVLSLIGLGVWWWYKKRKRRS